MTSEMGQSECFVYITLPGQTEPVTAGRFVLTKDRHGVSVGRFIYGRSYRDRPDAVELDGSLNAMQGGRNWVSSTICCTPPMTVQALSGLVLDRNLLHLDETLTRHLTWENCWPSQTQSLAKRT